MQATYSVPRSPLTVALVTAVLLAAVLLGGVGGYVLKGVQGAPVERSSSASGISRAASLVEGRSVAYVQGGRPAIVYAPEPPSIYVQGGRPQVVYDEVALLAQK